VDSLTRTGLSVVSASPSSDAVPTLRDSIRNLAAWAEAQGALYAQGLLSARPTAGKAGRLYRATDDVTGVIYYDDGSTWQAIGTSSAVDAAAGVGSLRTLGAGALQAAAGNHTHAIGAITGAGGAASLNVGTTAGTVAAGDHTHALVTGTQAVTKAGSTARSSTITLADDPDLQLSLAAGTYRITALLSVTGHTAGDIRVGWSFSGSWSISLRGSQGPGQTATGFQAGSAVVSYTPNAAGGQTYGTELAGSGAFIREELVAVVSSTGTLALQWAQDASSGTNTVMGAGSTLIAQRIA
jgi:hypothetical protein